MNRISLVLGGLLGISLLFNAVAAMKLSRREPAPATSKTAPAETARQPAAPAVRDPAPLPAPPPAAAPLREAPPRDGSPARTATPAPTYVTDPRVREVLDAQESFGALWKELDRVFKARGRLDEASYVHTVVSATAEFLALDDAQRVLFADGARAAAGAVAEARKEHDAARSALPPKDKSDATAYAAYQKQKDAIDARYDERVRAAAQGLHANLDANRPRHAEFMAGAEKWLKNLAKPAP